jgi:KDO2-lipid IV(A) lauroyltransferase
MVHFTEKDVREFCEIENYEIVKREFDKGKSVVIVLGHSGSWELACLRASLAIGNDAKQYAVYTKIGYEPLNEYVKKSRGKFGMQLFSMQEIAKQLRTGLGEKSIGIYLADQNHSNPKRAYWTTFLNQDTPFMTGPARFARAWNTSLFFVEIKQTARFHYAIHLELMQENVQDISPEDLTEQFVRRVEKQILENPADWLWSHKRWKHKRENQKSESKNQN